MAGPLPDGVCRLDSPAHGGTGTVGHCAARTHVQHSVHFVQPVTSQLPESLSWRTNGPCACHSPLSPPPSGAWPSPCLVPRK